MQLVDTHCHIHEKSYPLNPDEVLARAAAAGVTRVICVGTDSQSSIDAVEFAKTRENLYAIVGVHPHEAKFGVGVVPDLLAENPEIVGVGEIGLDYFYNHSPRQQQIEILNQQIELALKYDKPISFHVRDSFDDFWPIFDNFRGVRGVVHSYTDSMENLEKALARNLYIGVNGIATFCKVREQCEMYKQIPLSNLLLETDAPFLTPIPNRGKVNEPASVRVIAEFLSELYQTDLMTFAQTTSSNAEKLFSI